MPSFGSCSLTLLFNRLLLDLPVDIPVVGMDKVLAVYQENHLRESYGMIKMPRLDGKDRREFLDNVHCT